MSTHTIPFAASSAKTDVEAKGKKKEPPRTVADGYPGSPAIVPIEERPGTYRLWT